MTDDSLGDFEEFGDDAPDASEDSDTNTNTNTDTDTTGEDAGPPVDTTMPDDLPETEEGLERVELKQAVEDLSDRVDAAEQNLDRIRPLDHANPLGLDPRVGVKDLCFDRAKPGAKVYVVASLASSVDAYERAFPDAPALDDYAGNVLTRFSRDDAVLACVYVSDSLTSVDTSLTAYPMPESRLTRFPAEEASLVGSSEMEFARTNLPGHRDEEDEE